MGALVIILIGALGVFWYLGLLTPERLRIIAGIGLILIGILLTFRGAPFAGVPLAGLGGYLTWSGMRRPPDPSGMTPEQAAKLLGVPPHADEKEIRSAYRLAIASKHPDRGGSSEDSAALNEARDVLLAARRPR